MNILFFKNYIIFGYYINILRMTTRIVVQEYNGTELEVTYEINQQISGSNDIIVKKVFNGGFRDTTTMDGEEFMDELTLKGVVIGLTNKIHIFSLAPADKALFENLDELPMCIEFTVEPEVNLSKIPTINNQEYKTDECAICRENLFTTENGGPVVGLGPEGCGHKFHRNCIRQAFHFQGNKKCPLCRRPITGLDPIAIERADEKFEGKTSGKGGRRKKSRKGKKSRKINKTRKSKKGKKSRK